MAARARDATTLATLLRILDQAYAAKAWHGTTLRGALRGLTPRPALFRPQPRRHCIWELILHAAYWKYCVRRRITGDERASFPRAPSNWPRVPGKGTLRELRADIALLDEQHALLRAAIARMPERELGKRSPRRTWTRAEEISGVAAHDLYHAGQIQLLKRLAADA